MPNFSAAAHRHLSDGDFLHNAGRGANAVQLWAYGAECVIKAIAQKQGLFTLNAMGKPLSGFGLHINQLNNQGNSLLSLYNAAQTGPNALLGPAAAFTGWTISARYEDGTQLIPALATYLQDVAAFKSLLSAAYTRTLLP